MTATPPPEEVELEEIALKWLNKFRYSTGGAMTAEIPGALVRDFLSSKALLRWREAYADKARIKEAKLIGTLIADEEAAMAEAAGLKIYPEDMHSHKHIITDRISALRKVNKGE